MRVMIRSGRSQFWLAAAACILVLCARGSLAPVRAAFADDSNDAKREPILRIETGSHVAAVRRIAIDAANNYLVTGSDDKTLRVWQLQSGRLVRVIRPPINESDEGMTTALAVSPDGKTIASGMYGPPGVSEVVLFDLQTGKLGRHLVGLREIAHQLEYSRDGRYLAAVLYTGDLVIYDTKNYSLLTDDRDCSDESYGVEFDAKDRIYTTCWDGYIREYELTNASSLHLLVKVKAPSGKQPFPVAVSPDGTEIAVGYDDTPKIDVLSPKDLSVLFRPDITGVAGLAMYGLTWTADGQTMCAGGRWWLENGDPIRFWSNGGRGSYRDIHATDNTILQILPLRNGGIVFGSATPSFGVFDGSGKRTVYVGPSIADYRLNTDGFLLSRDGNMVQFGYEYGGKSPARFSIAERSLDTTPVGTGGLNAPIVEGLAITDWNSTRDPKLNGKSLPVVTHEMSRSLAIAPDGSGFLLGTEWHLYYFTPDGKVQWSAEGAGAATDVNISRDGRFAVAAFNDGTIRWYRLNDGKELLAFFPHNDRKRWVIWSPSGYYDASPGGEDLIGWHINNGEDSTADFFPVGQFRTTYYRPDIVARILDIGDEPKAIVAANGESGRKTRGESVVSMLPPVVDIVSPVDGADVASTSVALRYTIRTRSAEPVTDVKLFVDGRPISTERGVAPASASTNGDVTETTVSIPPHDTTVSVIANNRFAASTPATVHLHWHGTVTDVFEIKPKLYVLAIGVSKYANPSMQLNFAAKDAQDFAAALERQSGGLYREVKTLVLTDEKAKRDNVLDGLEWIRKQTTSKDVAMVLLSGHGVNDPSGVYFFLPYDADTERLLRTGISMDDIKTTIRSLAGKTLFFVDTCHSGNVLGGRRGELADINGVVNELASAENGAIVFAASTGTQYSIEDPTWSNGAFTKAVVEGFNGSADYSHTGRITLNMLDLYISERVKVLTRGQQTPTTRKPDTISDFPVALKR